MKNTFYYETVLGTLCIEDNGVAITRIGYLNAEEAVEDKKETALIKQAYRELVQYLEGKRKSFKVPLEPQGTPFQKSVWKALCDIPYGETRSYGEIAKKIGNAKASRAVGMANNRNPIAIMIPCHRVIGAKGGFVGYAGGLRIKEYLLKLEKAI